MVACQKFFWKVKILIKWGEVFPNFVLEGCLLVSSIGKKIKDLEKSFCLFVGIGVKLRHEVLKVLKGVAGVFFN